MKNKTVTAEDLASISTVEMAFGTTKFLPAQDLIPKEFSASSNAYARLASAIFYGDKLPDLEIELASGVTPEALNRFIRAHLASWEPKHEHKIAGVAYLLSQLCTLAAPKEMHRE